MDPNSNEPTSDIHDVHNLPAEAMSDDEVEEEVPELDREDMDGEDDDGEDLLENAEAYVPRLNPGPPGPRLNRIHSIVSIVSSLENF